VSDGIELAGGKQPLILHNPVICAAGTVGFGGEYARLFDMGKLGAFVTNPVTFAPRRASSGTRVVPLDSGVLVHTGLPNLGVNRVIRESGATWKNSPCPVIVHVVGTSSDDVAKCAQMLDGRENVAALELGLAEDATHRDVKIMVAALRENCELPITVRLPLHNAAPLARVSEEAGAGAVIVAAPPRGTARDPLSGAMIGGRVYGPWLRPLVIRAVGQAVHTVKIPVIAAGGIHNPDDAREYLSIGAKAVQVDAITWIRPEMAEIIARNVGGLELTRVAGSLADEWKPGLGETAVMRAQLLASPPLSDL
jgi:dihydroorotate dehydrogenase (NAD+) catalytic subunit